MAETITPAEVSWYHITLAGKQFNIASRRGESHIRNVERLVGDAIEEIGTRAQGQNPLHVALLAALNLADELLTLRNGEKENQGQWERRLENLVFRLDTVLPLDGSERKDTAEVFE